MKNIIQSKNHIAGKLYITLSVPFEVDLDSDLVLYEDKFGNPYYEEDYEYSVDEIIEKLPGIKSDLETFKSYGYTIEEISE